MKKSELISRIKELKSIKPDENWLILSKKALMSQISTIKPQSVKTPIFVFSWKYKLAGIICAIMLLFGGMISFAYSAPVDNPLYGLKITLSKAFISLAPQSAKMELRMALTEMITKDLNKKVGEYNNQLAIETLNQNLDAIAIELKQISHPQQIAVLSEKIQKETLKIKESLKQIPTDKPEVASAVGRLENQLQQVESETFTLKNEAEQKINNCPVYLDNSLNQIKDKIDALNLSDEKKSSVLEQLKQADELLAANHCVDALVIMENLEKDLGI